MNMSSLITWYAVRERKDDNEHCCDPYIAWYKKENLAIDFAKYHSAIRIKVYVQKRQFLDQECLQANLPIHTEFIWQSWNVEDGTFGKNLGYCEFPCPNCGRARLEQYENGYQVCEKCQWCPQEGKYVTHEDVFGVEEDWHLTL